MARNHEADTKRLDFLQGITGRYTGKVFCGWARRGLSGDYGWRLLETTRDDAVADVRQAIDDMMEREVKAGRYKK